MAFTNTFKKEISELIKNHLTSGTTKINAGTNDVSPTENETDLIWKSEDADVDAYQTVSGDNSVGYSFFIDVTQLNDLPYNIRTDDGSATDLQFSDSNGVKLTVKKMDYSFTIKSFVFDIKQVSATSSTVIISVLTSTGEVVNTQSIDVSSNSYSTYTVNINESTVPSEQYYILIKPVSGTYSVKKINSETDSDLFEDGSSIGGLVVSKIYIDRIFELGLYNDDGTTERLWNREVLETPIRKNETASLQIDWNVEWEIDG